MAAFLGIGEGETEKPEYSYTAHAIMDAFNTIARSRRYENGVPMPIEVKAIKDYLDLYDCPVELHIFIDAVLMIDNMYIDEAHERIAKQAKKKPSR